MFGSFFIREQWIAMINPESRLITVGQTKWVCFVVNPQLKFNLRNLFGTSLDVASVFE